MRVIEAGRRADRRDPDGLQNPASAAVSGVDSPEGTLAWLCDALKGHADNASWAGLTEKDWSRLVAAAEKEGVSALLHHALEGNGWLDRMPARQRWRLQRERFAIVANNVLLYEELSRILEALGHPDSLPDDGVSTDGSHRPVAVVLKGADLAMSLYPSIALRPMTDLDILVPPECLEGAVRTVESLGYRRAFPEIASGHGRLTSHEACLLGGPHGCVVVELHWNLVAGDNDRRSPPLDWFWDQVEPWHQDRSTAAENNGNTKARLPGSFFHFRAGAHVLYLAAHLMLQHGGSQARLLWYYDLHLLIDRFHDRLDWDEILTRARDFRWSASVNAALRRVRDRFGTPVSEGFMEALSRDGERQAAHSRPVESRLENRGREVWNELMCLTWPARWRFVRNHMFPSPAYIRWRYGPRPPWLWPFFYPYRWGVFVVEALGVLGNRAGRGEVERAVE